MQKYRKFIVALVGVALMVLQENTDAVPEQWRPYAPVVISVLTAIGVWAARNEEAA